MIWTFDFFALWVGRLWLGFLAVATGWALIASVAMWLVVIVAKRVGAMPIIDSLLAYYDRMKHAREGTK